MLSPTKMALAMLGLMLTGTAQAAMAAPRQAAASPSACFTDDGYGRKRPCSAGFRAKRAEQDAFGCFSDDGHGRKRPCAVGVSR